MPASYVHQCVAASASGALSLFDSAPLKNAVLAGSEGPDPFFFSVLTPGVPRLGSILHTQKTDDFLLALANESKDSDIARAYCCGFFSHYAADTTFHPFIYAHSLTQEGGYSSTAHCTLEHQIETLHYRRQGHARGVPRQMAGFAALGCGEKRTIAKALSQAVAAVFPGEALSVGRVLKSFEDAVALCRLLRSENGVRYRALGALLRPFHLDAPLHAHMMPREAPDDDITNDAHAPWRSLWAPEELRHESFDDLYDQAVVRSMELICAADSYMRGHGSYASLRALHGGYSYDSGLPWQTTCSARQAAERLSSSVT